MKVNQSFPLAVMVAAAIFSSLHCAAKKNNAETTRSVIIVLFEDGVHPKILLKEIGECALEIGNQISKSQNQWSFYQQCTGDALNELLERIRTIEGVIEVYNGTETDLDEEVRSGTKGRAKPQVN